MVSRLSPFAASLRSRLRSHPAMEDVAADISVIEAESVSHYPPAIFVQGELEKITGVPHDTTMAHEHERIRGGLRRHAPLLRYEFDNALVFKHGFCVKDASFARYGRLPVRSLTTEPMMELSRAHYAGSSVASRYFGHWLRDSCPTALLTCTDESLILPFQQSWPHARNYADLFSFNGVEANLSRVRRLSFHSDYGQGRSRQRRYEILRSRLRKGFENAPRDDIGSRVFLRRGDTGAPRAIADERSLMENLIAEGFKIADVSQMSVAEIVNAALDSDICVTMEGSHEVHAFLFLKRGGILINIQPSDRFNNIFHDYGSVIGLTYGFTVGVKSEAGYRVDFPTLMKTIDLAEKTRAQRS